MTTDLMTHLWHVAASGGAMHSQEARRLIAVLDGEPGDQQSVTAAQQLVEAFLHDPYLMRFD